MKNKKTQKPKVLANAAPSYGWKDRNDYKAENTGWIEDSMRVALKILDVLEERNMSQQDLAKKLVVSRQRVSSLLKGKENFTFETIHKLETALEIELIRVVA